MSYSQFSLQRVQADFKVKVGIVPGLFGNIAASEMPAQLAWTINNYLPVATGNVSEKARSELLIAPMLAEVWRRCSTRISLLSGVEFNVDDAAELNGSCDFLFTRGTQMMWVADPVLTVVEAKRENLIDGMGQCAAEMVAAQRFNAASASKIDVIYGCVSTGTLWKFLKLNGSELSIDSGEYPIADAGRILGILLHCVGHDGA